MTDYAVTAYKRDGHLKNTQRGNASFVLPIKDRENFTQYVLADANNNWIGQFWLRKDQTACANNDTITVTLG